MKHQYNYGMLGGGQICRTNDKEGLVFTFFFFVGENSPLRMVTCQKKN